MCTGTGFIAINLEKYSDNVVATDISAFALKTSTYNISLNECRNIELRNEEIKVTLSKRDRYNVITCNPPFVPVVFKSDKMPKYGAGPGSDGLDFYRAIIEKLPTLLAETGVCYFVGEFLGNSSVPYFYEELKEKYSGIMTVEFRIEIEKSFEQYAREYSNLMYFLDQIPRDNSIKALERLGFEKTYIGTITLKLNGAKGCVLLNKMNPQNSDFSC